jgi:HSP20 family protein
MTLVKYKPFRELKNLSADNFLDDLFSHSISDFIGTEFINTVPSVNISQSDDDYTIELAAPGLTKNQFSISLDQDQLIISAEVEASEEIADGTWNRKEFNYSNFKRSFHLSDEIDQDSISAKYQHGILSIVLKKKETAKPKEPTTIEIK